MVTGRDADRQLAKQGYVRRAVQIAGQVKEKHRHQWQKVELGLLRDHDRFHDIELGERLDFERGRRHEGPQRGFGFGRRDHLMGELPVKCVTVLRGIGEPGGRGPLIAQREFRAAQPVAGARAPFR